MKAAIYCRVSTDEQAKEGTSLDTQRDKCLGYIETMGWQAVEQYVDEGESGAKKHRPALDRLMQACKAGDVEVVVVTKLDRFGRSNRHLENALGDLDTWGVRFVSLSESFDSTTPAGRLLRTMLGGVGEFERSVIAERTQAGIRATVMGGWWPGGPAPHGYRVVDADDGTKHRSVEIEEKEADGIRLAAAVIVDEGGTVGDATRRLNALGFRRRKGTPWTRIHLRRRLMLSHWAGEWIWRSHTPEPVPLAIPPIMTAERMAALHRALAEAPHSGSRRPSNRVYSLSGRLFGLCGAPHSGAFRSDRQARYYRCFNRAIHAPEDARCYQDRWIRADDYEFVVWEAVCKLLAEPERLVAMAHEFLGMRGAEMRVEREQVRDVDRRVARLEEALGDAYADQLAGLRDAGALKQAIRKLEGELAALRDHRATLVAWQQATWTRASACVDCGNWPMVAHRLLADATPELQREVLELLDVKVWIVKHATGSEPAQVRIEGRVPDGLAAILQPDTPRPRRVEELNRPGIRGGSIPWK